MLSEATCIIHTWVVLAQQLQVLLLLNLLSLNLLFKTTFLHLSGANVSNKADVDFVSSRFPSVDSPHYVFSDVPPV